MARNERPMRVILGLVVTVMASVLLFFSSDPEFRCERSREGVSCNSQAKLFYRWPHSRRSVSEVKRIYLWHTATGTSRTPPMLMFETPAAKIDLGYFAQRFRSDWMALDAFMKDPSQRAIRLTKSLSFRAVLAHTVVVPMLLIGISLIASSLRKR